MSPRTSWLNPRALGLVAIGFLLSAAVLLVALSLSMLLPVDITVDGKVVTVPSDTTAGDLRLKGLVAAESGDLLGVAGGVVAPGRGEPSEITRDGRPMPDAARLYDGDVVTSIHGADVVERTVELTRSLPAEEVFTGSGPVVEIVSQGVDGVVSLKQGEVSGAVVASRVLEPAHPVVAMRRLPRKGERFVALTFDDGPWPGSTARILNTLRSTGTRATFFMIGDRAVRNPAMARRVVREGHQVGNHTLKHGYASKIPASEVARQIHVGVVRIRAVTGVRPTVLRPPGGIIRPVVLSQAKKDHQRIVMWTVDPQDWRRPGTKNIVKRVVGQAKPGSIILLHDGGGDRRQTAAALPEIIRVLKARGYTFVTVDELAAIDAASKRK